MIIKFFFSNALKFSALRNRIAVTFESHPKLANSCTGFLTFSFGDIIAQKLDTSKSDHVSIYENKINYGRSLQVGLLGVMMNGFFLIHWYRYLDTFIGHSRKSNIGVAMKIIADQSIYAPFAIVSFFSFVSITRGTSWIEIRESFKHCINNKFVQTYLTDCAMWPLANIINFRMIPLIYRPAFTGCAQLLWQTYLSLVSGGNRTKPNVKI